MEKRFINVISLIFDKVCDFYGISLQKLCGIKSRIIHKSCQSDKLGWLEVLSTQSHLQCNDKVEKHSSKIINPIFENVCDFHGISLEKLCGIKSRITHKSCQSDKLGLIEVLPTQSPCNAINKWKNVVGILLLLFSTRFVIFMAFVSKIYAESNQKSPIKFVRIITLFCRMCYSSRPLACDEQVEKWCNHIITPIFV